MAERKVLLHEMTRSAFEEWLQSEKRPVALIAVGSIEQHGPHLPLGTDTIWAVSVCEEIARRTNSIVVQPCWPGFSPHHMEFKGTITFSAETLLRILLETIGSLAKHGIRRFIIVNGHGGNNEIVALAARLAKRKFRVYVAIPRGPTTTKTAKKYRDRALKYLEVHSGARETGSMLIIRPDLVEMQRVEDWQPTTKLEPELEELMNPEREDREVAEQVFWASIPINTHEFTSSGIYALTHPKDADLEDAKKRREEFIEFVVKFINLWKKIPLEEREEKLKKQPTIY
ncbi:MAG: creatininase family protein [archaeon GB-1867-005]|nr:creatininase family protein [Candidatus Culexmicrobium cathedralense]